MSTQKLARTDALLKIRDAIHPPVYQGVDANRGVVEALVYTAATIFASTEVRGRYQIELIETLANAALDAFEKVVEQ